jgi:glycosyltransferase involved in cell wall biosynthesis
VRVGYLTYGLDRHPTGIGRYTVQLLRALHALPDRPELVLLTTERVDRHGLWDDFEHHPLPACRLLPALMTLGNVALSRAIRRHRLDLIHDPTGVAPFLGPRGGARRVVTIHDAFAFVTPQTHNRLDTWRYRRQLPHAARRADAVVTVSECSRRDLIHHLSLPPSVVHTTVEGVDPALRPVPDDAARRAVLARLGIRSPFLLYVGAINARKNTARLLEAYARVRARHPQLTLVIGGQRQWRTDGMDATLARLDLGGDVRFTGYLEDADLPALYSAAEVFVFPSLYEGFGLPPLEAMACGTPVVTSAVSSLPEVVGDAALTVDPHNVEALAAAMERVLTDHALRAALRQRGIARAARFTWERAARQTLTVYQHASRRAPGAPGAPGAGPQTASRERG